MAAATNSKILHRYVSTSLHYNKEAPTMMMKLRSSVALVSWLCAVLCMVRSAEASVFLPHSAVLNAHDLSSYRSSWSTPLTGKQQRELRLTLHRAKRGGGSMAMAIPGYGVAEQVVVGGFANFLSLYNLIITARVLLSWFPQAQEVGALQPVYAITDPYLNLFRGIIPPIFGLDLSPLLAFFLLSVMTNVTAAVGAEIPADFVPRTQQRFSPPRRSLMTQHQQQRPSNWSHKLLQRQQIRNNKEVSLDL